MSSKKFDEAEGISKRNVIDEDDVEGHSIQRGDGAISHKGADLGEGVSKRNVMADDDDDVEGHSMLRGDGVISRGDGVISRGDGISSRDADMGDGVTRRVGPGEGHTSRT